MNQVEKAEAVAMWAFKGINDLAGVPYITHCERVAHTLRDLGFDNEIQAIGWLHDVVEDTGVHLIELEKMGFSPRIIAGVDAMTQRRMSDGSREPLEDYWDRVFANPDAEKVKMLADMPDNDDPARKIRLGVGFEQRMTAKYQKLRDYHATHSRMTKVTVSYGDRPLGLGK